MISGRNNRKVMALVISMYGSRCAKCGQGIDVNRRYPDPLSPSIGHQLPQSKGGSDAIENLRPEHLRCNVKAQARIVEPPRRMDVDAGFF